MSIKNDLAVAGLGMLITAAIACSSPDPPFEPGWRFSQVYWADELPITDPKSNPIPSTGVQKVMPPIDIKTNSDGSASFRSNSSTVGNPGVSAQVTYADGTTGNTVTSTNSANWHGISAQSGHGGITSITFALEPPSTLTKTVRFTDDGWEEQE